jgi:hypothetical protein
MKSAPGLLRRVDQLRGRANNRKLGVSLGLLLRFRGIGDYFTFRTLGSG